MNVNEILKQWLDDHGYDGLVNGDAECGCSFRDNMGLAPCGHIGETQCEAAYKFDNPKPGDGECDFMMFGSRADGEAWVKEKQEG